jgi:ATP synthase protein I
MVAAIGKAQSAGGILVGALRAEAVKIGLMVVLLGVVLTIYKDVVVIAFLGTFMATAAIFSMAFFVREYD